MDFQKSFIVFYFRWFGEIVVDSLKFQQKLYPNDQIQETLSKLSVKIFVDSLNSFMIFEINNCPFYFSQINESIISMENHFLEPWSDQGLIRAPNAIYSVQQPDQNMMAAQMRNSYEFRLVQVPSIFWSGCNLKNIKNFHDENDWSSPIPYALEQASLKWFNNSDNHY